METPRANRLAEKYEDEEFLVADGFDAAILGIDQASRRVIYSIKKCLDILVKDEGMDDIDAIEHLNFNVLCAYVGEQTPIFMDDLDDDDDDGERAVDLTGF